MKNAILIIGAGTMQVPAIKEAQALGYLSIAVDGNPQAVGADIADIFIPQDLKEPQLICQHVEQLGLSDYIKAVFTAGTDFSYTVAVIAQYFSLPGNLPEAALAASRKHLMREKFQIHGVPSPSFTLLTETMIESAEREEFLIGLTKELSNQPLVVKPVDNMGSRGVRKITEPHELFSSIQIALSYSRSGACVVEGFIEGPEFSIDGLFFHDELICWGIARRHIAYPPVFIEIGHTFPPDLSQQQEQELLSIYTQGARALGITHGAVKGDIFLTPQGPQIGELAARLSGGYMSGWTLPLASGMNFTRAALQIALDIKPDPLPAPTKNWFVMERGLLSFPGTIKSIDLYDYPQHHPTYQESFIRVTPGQKVRFPQNNVEKVGNLIYAGKSLHEVQSQIFAGLEHTHFHLDPSDPISLETLLHPEDSKVPQAYEPDKDSNQIEIDDQQRSWDGRSYGYARSYLESHTYGLSDIEQSITRQVLIRFGLQAALICAEICKGTMSVNKQLLHDTYGR
jgi:biotin carboxylase